MRKKIGLSLALLAILATSPSSTHPLSPQTKFTLALVATLASGGATAYCYNKYSELKTQLKNEGILSSLDEVDDNLKKVASNEKAYRIATLLLGATTAGLTAVTCKLGFNLTSGEEKCEGISFIVGKKGHSPMLLINFPPLLTKSLDKVSLIGGKVLDYIDTDKVALYLSQNFCPQKLLNAPQIAKALMQHLKASTGTDGEEDPVPMSGFDDDGDGYAALRKTSEAWRLARQGTPTRALRLPGGLPSDDDDDLDDDDDGITMLSMGTTTGDEG